MVWAHQGNGLYLCESTDTKVTANITTGSILFESTVGSLLEKAYRFNGTIWEALSFGVGGGGGGDITGALNVGTGQGLIFRDEVAGVLNLKRLLAGSNVTITNGTDDITIAAAAGGSGEVNTASAFGSTGVSIFKDKNVADLRFYRLHSENNKLTVALNGTDHIDLTVVDTNLVIDWSQLTTIPSASTTTPGIVQLATPSADTTAGRAVQASDARLSNARTALAHKDTHDSTGGDAFGKTDVLAAPARYVENRADPTTDSGAIWIQNTSEVIRHWDTLATPVIRELVNLNSAQILATKTVNVDANTIKHSTTNTSGDLLVNNGTSFQRLARGTAMQVYRINAAGTAGEFASLDSERTGKAVANGNGSATIFTIAHGLGSVPGYVFIDCSSHAINRTYVVDATNITVTFTSAPSAGTNNVIIYWRVIAT